MILWTKIEIIHFYHFDSVPRFPPFLLYVRWKSGVTFVRRCFRDECEGTIYLFGEKTKFIPLFSEKSCWFSQNYFCCLAAEAKVTSRKHLLTKVTPDLHLTYMYSKDGGNLGLVLNNKMWKFPHKIICSGDLLESEAILIDSHNIRCFKK